MPKWFSTTVESQPPPTMIVGRTSSGVARRPQQPRRLRRALVRDGQRLGRERGVRQQLLERRHLEVEGVGEAGIDGRAVQDVVGDPEHRGRPAVALAGRCVVAGGRGRSPSSMRRWAKACQASNHESSSPALTWVARPGPRRSRRRRTARTRAPSRRTPRGPGRRTTSGDAGIPSGARRHRRGSRGRVGGG